MPPRISLPQFNNPLIRLNSRCPICSTPYDFQRLKILGEREQSVLAFLECGQCGTSVLSLLQIGASGLSTHFLMTDLLSDEVETRLEASGALTSDELIDFHAFIENMSAVKALLEPSVKL